MRTHEQAISDAAKRVSDAYSLHRIADPSGSIGKWIAVRLSDGTGGDTLYDSKSDAVTYQHHDEQYFAFIQIRPATFGPTEAQTYLDLHRRMYDAGIKLADPDHRNGGRDVITRVSAEDQYNQIAAMFGHGSPSNISYRKG